MEVVMKLSGVRKKVSWILALVLCTQILMPSTPVVAKASLAEDTTMLDKSSATESEVNSIEVVKGSTALIKTPEGFKEPITWTTIFKDSNGNPIKNVGFDKKKYELSPGERDKHRVEGITSTEHIAKIEKTAEGGLITAFEKGMVYAKAVDSEGKSKEWKVNVLYTAKENLPKVTSEDYKRLIGKWTAQLIGENPDANDAAIMETINSLNTQAQALWDSYRYKGQSACADIPWPEEIGKKGNKNIEFARDAVEFRQTFKNVLLMAKAYRVEHGALYNNKDLLNDMINILDWLTTNCYRPQSQTDNWWTWEIGIPKDIVPTLILLADDLTKEQKEKFTEGVRFFQPDPYHGGSIGTGSTHGQGYRMQYAANRVDCSMTALGIGLLLEDNESVYLASEASSSVLEFVSVEDSTKLAEKGYPNGYYKDGSYIDHTYVPYAGSYGIVVLEGIVNISAILSNSPWQFSSDKANILENIFVKTYGMGVYNGLMLDNLRGRAVSREKLTDKSIGRQVMTYIIKSLDTVSETGRQTLLNYLKNWLTADSEFVGTLKELNEIVVKQKAQEIIGNAAISGVVESAHKNYPLMDRAVHRTDNWLFTLSMFSERIQNTEIMNGENLYGWHQSDGMTYLYGKDTSYYNDNYWNTINPFRLPGTTTVSKNIGNGVKDSSGFYQEGDYTSKEAWVGGSELGGYGINGMSLSGDCGTKTKYEPNLRALKSYFMFGDEIVCLGSGINDSDSNFITETTVENRKLNDAASNRITVNGNKLELAPVGVNVAEIVKGEGLGTGVASMEGKALENVKWVHLEGNVEGDKVGFYFPKEAGELKARIAASTGNWGNINLTATADVVKNYFELWFDHGKNPQNAEYSYVILPGRTEEEMKEYEKNPSVEILANTDEVQAVGYKNKSVIGANFWQDKAASVSGISSDKKASIIVKQSGDVVEIGVSDPTMKNLGTIEVDIDKEFGEVISADPNVTVAANNGKVHLVVNTAGKNGDTSYAVVRLKTNKPSTPTGIPVIPVIPAKKPSTPEVSLADDKTPEGKVVEGNTATTGEEKKNTAVKKIKLNFNLTKAEVKKGIKKLSKILVKKFTLKKAAKEPADLSLSVRDEKKKVIYSWFISGKELAASKSKFKDLSLGLKVIPSVKIKPLKSLLKGKNGAVVSFTHRGKFPAPATVKIHDKHFKYPKNTKLYVYKYNEKKNRIEKANGSEVKAVSKGVITLKVSKGSDYLVLPNKLGK